MSGDDKRNEILEAFKPFLEQLEAQVQREAARVAQLTPEQRRAEAQEKQRQRQLDAARGHEAKIQKAARPYRGHESMPLRIFAALLHGVDRDALDEYWVLPQDLRTTIDILTSCVGGSIRPWNAGMAGDKLMFATRELIAVARSKRFPDADLLARALGIDLSRQGTPAAATPKMVSAIPGADRKQQVRERPALVQHAIETLIPMYEKVSGHPVVRDAPLPLTHGIIFECFDRMRAKRGWAQISSRRVRDAMPRDYRLMEGNPDDDRIVVLQKLRELIKTVT